MSRPSTHGSGEGVVVALSGGVRAEKLLLIREARRDW